MSLLTGAHGARAATFTWVGDGSAPWNVATNWSPEGVPSTGDEVVIGETRTLVVDGQEIGTIDVLLNDGSLFHKNGEWNGDVIVNNDRIQNQDHSTWNGDIWANTGVIVNLGGSTWTGDILSNAGYIDNEDLNDTWYGNIQANSDDIFNGGTWNGDIFTNDDFISNFYSYSTWNGDVRANAVAIYNAGTWNGDVLSNAGIIENGKAENDHLDSTWNGDILANAGTISSIGTWNGSLTSSGTLIMEGQVNGAINNSGTLQVSADLAGITALTNTGTLTMTGNSTAQTLTAASASFGTNSILSIDVDATGASDRIVLTGAAVLGGVVNVTAAAGTYDPYTSYAILSASSISGQFDGVTVNLAYLAPRLSQDATTVTLALMRNDIGFGSVGITPTQMEIGTIIEALGAGNALYDGVLWLNAEQAAGAFDALSGRAYLATERALIQSAALVAGGLADRLEQSFNALGSTGGSTSSYAATAPESEATRDRGLWGQLYGASSVSAESSVAESSMTAGGLVAGRDSMVGDWRLGLMLNAGTTRSEITSQGASATSTDYGLGLYAGREWGNTRLSLGATFTRHDIEATRNVDFTDFSETLTASYGAATALAFTELSHEIDLGGVSVTPFGSLTHIRHATDSFAESGGEAALTGEASFIHATYTVIGVGVTRQMALDNGVLITAGASLGWRHTFADRSVATHHFRTGGSFSLVGGAVEADAMLVGADLMLDLDATNAIKLHYDGRLGSGTQAHALSLGWASQF
jgi:fibronectin-binding autotransporter adhesin